MPELMCEREASAPIRAATGHEDQGAWPRAFQPEGETVAIARYVVDLDVSECVTDGVQIDWRLETESSDE